MWLEVRGAQASADGVPPVDRSRHVLPVLAIAAGLVAYVGFYALLALQTLDCSGTAGAALQTHICDYDDGGGVRGEIAYSWGWTFVVDTVIVGALLAWCVRSRRWHRTIAAAAFVSYLVVARASFIVYVVHATRDTIA